MVPLRDRDLGFGVVISGVIGRVLFYGLLWGLRVSGF